MISFGRGFFHDPRRLHKTQYTGDQAEDGRMGQAIRRSGVMLLELCAGVLHFNSIAVHLASTDEW